MDKAGGLRNVVDTGSFAEARRQLRLSRSAVGKCVAELEQSLGVVFAEILPTSGLA
jgi:DNA-binding transcriptional LysR family regulator